MLGDNIKLKRKSMKMTAAELAKQVNISQAYLSEIENNKKVPTLEILQNISKALNTTVSTLIGETDNTLEPLTDNLRELLDTAKELKPKDIEILKILANHLKNQS